MDKKIQCNYVCRRALLIISNGVMESALIYSQNPQYRTHIIKTHLSRFTTTKIGHFHPRSLRRLQQQSTTKSLQNIHFALVQLNHRHSLSTDHYSASPPALIIQTFQQTPTNKVQELSIPQPSNCSPSTVSNLNPSPIFCFR